MEDLTTASEGDERWGPRRVDRECALGIWAGTGEESGEVMCIWPGAQRDHETVVATPIAT